MPSPLPQMLRFAANGLAATGTHAALLYAGTLAGWGAVPANAAAFLVAVGVTYLGQRFWVFGTSPAMQRFLAVIALGLVLQTTGMWTLRAAGVPLWWAWLALTFLVPLVSYIAMKFWAFAPHPSHGTAPKTPSHKGH